MILRRRAGRRSRHDPPRHPVRPIAVLAVVCAALLAAWLAPRVSAQVRAWVVAPPVRGVMVDLSSATGTPSQAALSRIGSVARREADADASQGRSAAVSPGIRFNMLGFVCPSGVARPRVEYRVADADGSWSPWRRVMFDAVRGRNGRLRYISDPVWTGSAGSMQVRGAGWSSARAAFVNVLGDASTGDRVADALRKAALAVTGLAAGSEAQAATSRPPIVTRKQWGAKESWRRGKPSYGQVKFAVVHHTVGGNTYTRSQAAAVVRAVYYYHTKACGFSDIGYNFLIDRYGTIYEGRYGGITKAVMGAQALGFNSQSTGVSLMGDFRTIAPPTAALASLEKFLAWKLDSLHIDPCSRVSAYCSDTDKFKGGTTVRVPAIALHREVCNTDCPGDSFSALIGTIRKVVADTGLPKIYGFMVTPGILSPNADGSHGQALVEFIASEEVDWVVAVTDVNGVVVRTLTGAGQTVSVAWDGLDDAGLPVPDGTYVVMGDAAGASGVATQARAKVIVDTSPPTLAVQPVKPAVVNPEGGVLDTCGTVEYSITEPCAVKAVIRDQTGAALCPVQTWTSKAAGEYSVSWDGRTVSGGKRTPVSDGVYNVEITVRDVAGNKVAKSVPMTIDSSLRLDASAPIYASPNGDEVAESADLTFTMTKTAKVQLAVTRGARQVRTASLGKLTAGGHKASWDGLDDSGAPAADGKYLVTLSIAGVAGTARAGAEVVVDTGAPRISVGKAAEIALGAKAATVCIVRDAGSPTVSVDAVVRDARKRVVRRVDSAVVTPGKKWTFRFVPPKKGRYTATFSAVDLAGNRQEKLGVWKVRVR